MSVTTITGKNGFVAHQKLIELRTRFVEEYGESGVVEIDGEEATIAQVSETVMSQGLFSSASFVVLRDFAKNKYLQEKLPELLENVPSETQLVLFDTNFDRRTSFFKSLKQSTQLVDCAVLDERDLAQWAREEFKKLGGELGFAEAQFLVQRVNMDQWLLHNELQKLASVEGDITRDVIEDMVDESFNESIFNLLDDAFAKRADRALKTYRAMLANKVEAHYVFSMLVWQLHTVLVVAYAGSIGAEQIAKDNKLSPFVVRKSQGLFAKTTREELHGVIDKAVQIDTDSKSRASYNMNAAVDMLIAQIAA